MSSKDNEKIILVSDSSDTSDDDAAESNDASPWHYVRDRVNSGHMLLPPTLSAVRDDTIGDVRRRSNDVYRSNATYTQPPIAISDNSSSSYRRNRRRGRGRSLPLGASGGAILVIIVVLAAVALVVGFTVQENNNGLNSGNTNDSGNGAAISRPSPVPSTRRATPSPTILPRATPVQTVDNRNNGATTSRTRQPASTRSPTVRPTPSPTPSPTRRADTAAPTTTTTTTMTIPPSSSSSSSTTTTVPRATTSPPTRQPTSPPTSPPTRQPTPPPTSPPTRRPTLVPTSPPPTRRPSPSPTSSPTPSPTSFRTPSPTIGVTSPPPTVEPTTDTSNSLCTCCTSFGATTRQQCTCFDDVESAFCRDDLSGSTLSCGAGRQRCSESQNQCSASSPSSCVGAQRDADSTPKRHLVTSLGNAFDQSAGGQFCCGGTLAAIVRSRTTPRRYYLLSNAHVIAAESASPSIGQTVINPALIDTTPRCSADQSTPVASLTRWEDVTNSRVSHRVDAALALLDWSSTLHDLASGVTSIGRLSDTIVQSPSLALAVKKSGRTTGLTRGRITGINAAISVQYSVDCGSSQTRTVQFTNQLIVQSVEGGAFSQGGDSGSLVVTDTRSGRPQAVGLLFAGNDQISVVSTASNVENEMDIDFFDASIFAGVLGASTTANINASSAPVDDDGDSPITTQVAVANVEHVLAMHAIDSYWVQVDAAHGLIGRYVGTDPTGTKACVYVVVESASDPTVQDIPPTMEDVDIMIEEMPTVRAQRCGPVH